MSQQQQSRSRFQRPVLCCALWVMSVSVAIADPGTHSPAPTFVDSVPLISDSKITTASHEEASPIREPVMVSPRPVVVDEREAPVVSTPQPPAPQTPAWPETGEPTEFDPLPVVKKIISGTVFVVMAMAVMFVAVRKWMKANGTLPEQKSFKVIDTLPLRSRSVLQLIEVEGQRLVVGVDGSGLKSVVPLAKTFAAELELEALTKQPAEDTSPDGSKSEAAA